MPSVHVLAVVAAFREEENVARTVKSLYQSGAVDEVLVVDDGSRDATAAEANGAGARVLLAPRNLGKGLALEAALDRAPAADVYLFVDADTGDTAGEASRLVEAVLAGTADLAVGRLPALPGGGLGLVRRAAAGLLRVLTGLQTEAPMSGQRAVSRRALDGARPLAAGFGMEVAMTIDVARLGFRVVEVPVEMTHRPTGRGPRGFAHRARQGMDVLAAWLPRAAGIR